MLFYSDVFVFLFLPGTLLLYLVLERRTSAGASIGFLAAASLIFYAWWNPVYLPLLLGSIGFNFAIGHLIVPEGAIRYRRACLIVGVVANLALLALFKYADFAARTLGWLSHWEIPEPGIILPLAISFFTFQQITFLVDSYLGNAPERGFPAYCMYVAFFPQLIAGPIVHNREMMPQFARLYAGNRRSDDEIWHDLAVGFTIFTIGLVKKLVFADQFGLWADNAFGAAEAGARISFIEAWVGVSSFAFQIYLDFSGYSDMAIGLARLFGIKLPLNFDSPYKATSIIDFWRRWHMTLSRFLRDYLYVPLGGNRLGPERRYLNIMIVMLIGGLWHGASWTFVLWGGLHGLYLAINHGYRALQRYGAPVLGNWSGRLLTLLCVFVAWTFFRADTFDGALAMLSGLAGVNGVVIPLHWESALAPITGMLSDLGMAIDFGPVPAYSGRVQLLWLFAGFLAMWFLPNTQEFMRHHDPAVEPVTAPAGLTRFVAWQPLRLTGAVFGLVGLLMVAIIIQGKAGEFIYFQF